MSILVTGGVGFIGANFVLEWFESDEWVINKHNGHDLHAFLEKP